MEVKPAVAGHTPHTRFGNPGLASTDSSMEADLLDVVLSDAQLLEVILPWMVADGEQPAMPDALSARLDAKQTQTPADLRWTPASFRLAVLNTVRCADFPLPSL